MSAFLFKRLVAAVVLGVGLSLISMPASAATLPGVTDDYSGTYNLEDAFPSHGLWLPHFRDGASKTWSVQSGTATYDSSAGTLDLNGTVRNNTDPSLELVIDFSLNEISHAGPPACGKPGCASPTADMVANVKYFDFVDVMIKGVSGLLSGLTLDLSIKPKDGEKPPQFGYGANWVDLNFGYSNWFYWTVSDAEKTQYGLKNLSGHGDVNVNMSPVPLPAAGWLLLAGVGALGAMRHRRRRSG